LQAEHLGSASWGVMIDSNCIDVLFWHLRRDSGREIFGVGLLRLGGPDRFAYNMEFITDNFRGFGRLVEDHSSRYS
jgi:hypothetical protein